MLAAHLVNNVPNIYGDLMSVTVFTRPQNWSLSSTGESFHTLTPYSFKTNLNIIPPSKSSKRSLAFIFGD
jgi:hypothetical protein